MSYINTGPAPSIATEEVERRNVAMYPRNWAVVDEINARYDLGSTSSSLRFIISEYQRLAAEETERNQANR